MYFSINSSNIIYPLQYEWHVTSYHEKYLKEDAKIKGLLLISQDSKSAITECEYNLHWLDEIMYLWTIYVKYKLI